MGAMSKNRMYLWSVLLLALAGCPNGETSTSSSGTTASESEGESETEADETTGITEGATDTTDAVPACPQQIWTGDFVGTPEELEGYTEVTGFVRLRETDAQNLEGMECLERIGSFLEIRANPNLKTLQGVLRLEHVGVLGIIDNPMLTDLSGLDALLGVDGRVTIEGNAALTTLHGLEGLQNVGENVEIRNDDELGNLQGLTSLTDIGGIFLISSNDSLLDCTGVNALISTGGIDIWSNPELGSLTGFESIVNIGDSLRISSNPVLDDVLAMEGGKVDTDGEIEITSNALLPQCQAEALAEAIKPDGYMGQEDVNGNQGTCP